MSRSLRPCVGKTADIGIYIAKMRIQLGERD
jgi:hypothetical protein